MDLDFKDNQSKAIIYFHTTNFNCELEFGGFELEFESARNQVLFLEYKING